MAKLSSGEITVQTENRRIALRLNMGETQELEEYFGISILDILLEKFNDKTPLTDDLMMVYAAMTGRDIKQGCELIEACTEMMEEVGISSAVMGVKQCLWSTNAPRAHSLQGQKLEKPQAVQTHTQRLSRKTLSWAQQLMKMK